MILLTCVLFAFVSITCTVSTAVADLAAEEQDVIRLLRWKSPSLKSECHVYTDAAVQWDGADVATEKTVRYAASPAGDYYLSRLCQEYGIFCRYPEMSGWKVKGNFQIDVPLPPYTDSIWELLPLKSTHSCIRQRYAVNSTYFALSVKGDSVINIQFEGDGGDAGGVYGITLGDSVSSEVTEINRHNNSFVCPSQVGTVEIQNANKWRHFWISVRNGNITVGHLNGMDSAEPISWVDPLPPLTYKYISISSESSDETLWKLHSSNVLYIQKRTRDQGFLEGYFSSRSIIGHSACITFQFFMTPGVGLSLDVHIGGLNLNISSSSTEFEWKKYKAYNPIAYGSEREYLLSIEGIFPEDAPDDAIIAIANFRLCKRGRDILHTSTVPGNNSLFCSLAFPSPPHQRIPCSKVCHNGGKCYDGKCVCALGFTGKHCEEGIPVCGLFQKCEGNQICSITTKQCVCAAGFQGMRCNRRCPPGTYGPNCTGQCGQHCGRGCEEHTGICRYGCEGRYQPPFCLFPLPYLKEGPRLEHVTANSLNISIRFGEDNYEGDGDPAFYSVHHQKVGENNWVKGSVNEIPHSTLTDFTSFYVIENLEAGTEYTVRIVILEAYKSTKNNTVDAPTSIFKTTGPTYGQLLSYVIAGIVVGIISMSALGVVVFVLIRRYKHRINRRGLDQVIFHPITEAESVTTVNVGNNTTRQSDATILCDQSE